MQQEQLDAMEQIENLKNDEQFQQNLQTLAKEAKEENSVAKMYQVLDATLLVQDESQQDEAIDEIYTLILQTSFDDLAKHLAEEKKFDHEDEEHLAKLRAIYEHGIEKYSSGDFTGAKEIFLVLYHVFDAEHMKLPLLVHVTAASKEVDFEDFFQDFADARKIAEDTSAYAYFIKDFKIDAESFLEENSEALKAALVELEGLRS